MLDKISKSKPLYFLTVLILGLIVLWPSFRLALTGDDYLSLYRFQWQIGNQKLNYNYFTYWLTDYGPQDTITALIHSLFGFYALPYYIFSFVCRFAAALTFYPLITLVTKNKKSALVSSAFFIITTAGLETTDWVFNVPSYIAIGVLNIFFYSYIKDSTKERLGVRTLILFIFSVIAQPIRMLFLPLAVFVKEAYQLVVLKTKRSAPIIVRTIAIFILFFILFKLSDLGGTIGLRDETISSSLGFWNTKAGKYFSAVHDLYQEKELKYLMFPIGQIGAVFFPTNAIPGRLMFLGRFKALITVLVPILLLFWFGLGKLQKDGLQKNYLRTSLAAGLVWMVLVWYVFMYTPGSAAAFSGETTIPLILGGPVLISMILIHQILDSKMKRLLFILAVSIILIPVMIPWLRNPKMIHVTWGRYLIVPAAGLSMYLGLLYSKLKNLNFFKFGILFVFLIHIYSSYLYLDKLANVRAAGFTQQIRGSIPFNPDFKDENKTLVYYFTTNNPSVLHHSLIFGFPVIMHYQYQDGINNPWRIVYTDSWSEVVSAFTDGKAVSRFLGREDVVDLDNIYSFDLHNHQLTETTKQTRERLSDIKKD